MAELLKDIDLVFLLIVFGIGMISFTLSTISGGGGALLMIPILNFFIGATKTAPVINLGTLISRPSRIIIFWKDIVWKVFWYYVPIAILGSVLAAWLFSEIKIVWIQIVVALFLISTYFQYRFGKKEQSFKTKLWHFIPLGLIISMVGTFTGGMGPVLNPFYLNAGISKEALIGTKSINSFFIGLAQVSSYTVFGLLTPELWIYGFTLGIGATVGNLIGKNLLKKMTHVLFRKFVIVIMVISGCLLLYKSLVTILS